VAAAAATGDVAVDPELAAKAPRLLVLMFVNTVIGALITEDGYFRGWLWGSLRRSGFAPTATLVWTGAAFALWHLPVAIIEEDFALPASVIPVYLTNVFLLGMAWGLLRQASGSVIVAAFCHGVWNALAYTLFGYGTESGALGVSRYTVFGPERGFLGLLLNAAAVVVLWRWAMSGSRRS
jgi:membrane protease YdiL (CAAX protease family)